MMFGWLVRELRSILEELKELNRLVASILKVLRLCKPGLMFVRVVREGENSMLKFTIMLPPPGASDVVERRFMLKMGDQEPIHLVLGPTVTETDNFIGNDNEVLFVQLIDVDDAGNNSPAREQNFVLVDSLAPPQPGELGVRVVAET